MERHALAHLIAQKIAERFDDVEVVDFELRGGRDPLLTVYIDRPSGVDLDLCVAVTHALDVLRDQYRLEVSSPGLDRPLRKREQFARVTGSEVTVKTAAPVDGRASYRGVLTAADEAAITMRLDDGRDVTIPYVEVARARLVPTFDRLGGQRE
jgi:ribosome maturation factor RimP